MTYGDLHGKRVLMDDGTVLDVTGGFAANGSQWSDRKLFGARVEDGMSVWSRGYCISRVLGDTPDDRVHVFVVYRVSTDARQATDEDIYASVVAATASEAEELVQTAQGCRDRHLMGVAWDHPVWGFEADGGFRYHLFPFPKRGDGGEDN